MHGHFTKKSKFMHSHSHGSSSVGPDLNLVGTWRRKHLMRHFDCKRVRRLQGPNSPNLSKESREVSTLTFKIRSGLVRTDLRNKRTISRTCLILKIRSCNARSDLKNKSARFSGGFRGQKTPISDHPRKGCFESKNPFLYRAP